MADEISVFKRTTEDGWGVTEWEVSFPCWKTKLNKTKKANKTTEKQRN